MELTNKEITDRIFDTLLGNVGMSEIHVAFNPEDVVNQECNARDGVIVLQLKDGRNIQIVITDAPADYFTQE